MRISLPLARRLALQAQGLGTRWPLPKGKEGVAQAVERMGRVQIDTIAVVQRAHHHSLWTRRPDYHPDVLDELQARDRRVFEYWARGACYLPMCDYRYYVPAMRGAAGGRRTRSFLEQNATLVQHVRDRIRADGPLGSADFKSPDDGTRGPWWDWKPAKRALETLFNAGELMIARRRNFQRLYDFAERVLPPDLDTTPPERGELLRFAARRALGWRGIGTAGELSWARYGGAADGEALRELLASGEVTQVTVRGLDGEARYAMTSALEAVAGRRGGRKKLHILSPFDNVVIHRHRLAALFGFHYKLECYHPAAKRQHGYFCLPILWGTRFVGRLDPKADRKQKTLIVRGLFLEPDPRRLDGLLHALARKLRAFAAFNDCERVTIERTTPGSARAPLMRELDAARASGVSSRSHAARPVV